VTFRESDVTQALDDRGRLGDARGPGVYALRLRVPDDAERVHRDWLAEYDALPGDDALDRLAAAEQVAYVGASTNIYRRLCDHAAGRRRPSLLAVFKPTSVERVWPRRDPFDGPEYNRALRLARDDWVVWCNGELLG